jgi:signal transduction histidine kinase
MSAGLPPLFGQTGTFRFRLVASLVLVTMISFGGIGLAFAGRISRNEVLREFGTTRAKSQALGRLDRCLSDLHRQATFLAQTYGEGTEEPVAAFLIHEFADSAYRCNDEMAVVNSAGQYADVAQQVEQLLEDLTRAVRELGVNYVDAILLMATRVDPVAEALMSGELVAIRSDIASQIDRLDAEIASLGRKADQTLLAGLLFPLLTFAFVVGWLLRRLLASLSQLMETLRVIGAGDLEHRVVVEGEDEFATVAERVNQMTEQLADNRRALAEYARKLEQSLESLETAQKTAVEQQKLAALGGLVAGIAHEVNTPLGVAVTSTSLLTDFVRKLQDAAEQGTATRGLVKRSCADLVEVLVPLEANLARAARLIRSFKQVAVDRSAVVTRVVSLEEWVRAAMRALAPEVRRYDVTLKVDVPSMPVRLAAGELEQVLSNLVLNACIHAFPEGSVGRRSIVVTLAHDAKADRLLLRVEDNGAGMTPDVQGRIFEPFFTTKRGQGGSGLGMHIVHQLVRERFGGRITLTSTLGEGTQFEVSIPYGTQALSTITDPRRETGPIHILGADPARSSPLSKA